MRGANHKKFTAISCYKQYEIVSVDFRDVTQNSFTPKFLDMSSIITYNQSISKIWNYNSKSGYQQKLHSPNNKSHMATPTILDSSRIQPKSTRNISFKFSLIS